MRTAARNSLAVPFFKTVLFNLGWFFVAFGVLVITGAANAVNLTDGLDGLAIGQAMIAAAAFALDRLPGRQRGLFQLPAAASCARADELMVFCGALVGSSLGFMWFNAPPPRSSWATPGRCRSAPRSVRSASSPSMSWCWRHRRDVCPRGGLGHRAGRELQDDRPAGFPDGGRCTSFRAAGLGGTEDRDPFLDHRADPGDRRAGDAKLR